MKEKIRIFPDWWVWRPSDVIPTEPYVKWAGPFESKSKAESWIAKSPDWPAGMRSGKSAIVWEEEHK